MEAVAFRSRQLDTAASNSAVLTSSSANYFGSFLASSIHAAVMFSDFSTSSSLNDEDDDEPPGFSIKKQDSDLPMIDQEEDDGYDDSKLLSSKSCLQQSLKQNSPSNSRKSVRFADDDGQPLVDVFVFSETPVIGSLEDSHFLTEANAASPVISAVLSRLFNRAINNSAAAANVPPSSALKKQNGSLEQLFPDPLENYSALTDRLRRQQVALESVLSRGGAIQGMVRVRSLDDDAMKSVFVRLTFDSWATHYDWKADVFPILPASWDDSVDYSLFEFTVPIPPHLNTGDLAEFAICFRCGDREFWDNNDGSNYRVRYIRQQQTNVDETSNKTATLTTTTTAPPNVSIHKTAAELDEERAQRIRDAVLAGDSTSSFYFVPPRGHTQTINTSNNNSSSNPDDDATTSFVVTSTANLSKPQFSNFTVNVTTTIATSTSTMLSPAGIKVPYW